MEGYTTEGSGEGTFLIAEQKFCKYSIVLKWVRMLHF